MVIVMSGGVCLVVKVEGIEEEEQIWKGDHTYTYTRHNIRERNEIHYWKVKRIFALA